MPSWATQVQVTFTIEHVADADNLADAVSDALVAVDRSVKSTILGASRTTCTAVATKQVSEFYGEGDAAK